MNLYNKFKISVRYFDSHFLHDLLVSKKGDKTIEQWMKQDWDNRAEKNALYYIHSVRESEKQFWQSGMKHRDMILGINTPLYSQITNGINPKEMKVLEIGCGIGRILIPTSKVFGEVVGVDVSKKMVEKGRKLITKIPNCKIFENSGSDLSIFSDNAFDFCYSYIVFQHIPDKKIVTNYIKEISRVLKPKSIFRFEVKGKQGPLGKELDTWKGVSFSSNEMHDIAEKHNFEVLDESGKDTEQYWLTFKSIKDEVI